MAEKAATRVNFRRFSLVSLSFINRIPWKLVKMCILISLTKHITTTFWSHHFYMPEQANIWQKRLRRGSIFADFRLFLSHLLTEVHENWSKRVSWLAISWLPIILLQVPHQASYTYQNKPISYKQVFCKSRMLQFFHVSLQFLDMSQQKLLQMCKLFCPKELWIVWDS